MAFHLPFCRKMLTKYKVFSIPSKVLIKLLSWTPLFPGLLKNTDVYYAVGQYSYITSKTDI